MNTAPGNDVSPRAHSLETPGGKAAPRKRPPAKSDRCFVVDTPAGGGLQQMVDGGCLFNWDVPNGRIIIDIPVTRYAGPTDRYLVYRTAWSAMPTYHYLNKRNAARDPGS